MIIMAVAHHGHMTSGGGLALLVAIIAGIFAIGGKKKSSK